MKLFITGATDGIGLETAKKLATEGHQLLIHGRSQNKLDACLKTLLAIHPDSVQGCYLADLSDLAQVRKMAQNLLDQHSQLDVLINNAGVYKTPHPILSNGQDVRFVVNTVAPYLLTQSLLSILPAGGRIINLSSAAQAPVNLNALSGQQPLDDMAAYAQSKLAITQWTQAAAQADNSRTYIAVNPGSLLASKMVHEGFGVAGSDLSIGADILCRAALDAEFDQHSGEYFDNDSGQFAEPECVLNSTQQIELLSTLEQLLNRTE